MTFFFGARTRSTQLFTDIVHLFLSRCCAAKPQKKKKAFRGFACRGDKSERKGGDQKKMPRAETKRECLPKGDVSGYFHWHLV
jgi:hypothetical protein